MKKIHVLAVILCGICGMKAYADECGDQKDKDSCERTSTTMQMSGGAMRGPGDYATQMTTTRTCRWIGNSQKCEKPLPFNILS